MDVKWIINFKQEIARGIDMIQTGRTMQPLLMVTPADLNHLMDFVDQLLQEKEEFESVLGAYVLPTLIYIRHKNPIVSDLIAEIVKRLEPFRGETQPSPKSLPINPNDTPRG